MNNKEIFSKINEILLQSLKPSEDLERLIVEGNLDKYPFDKIKKLKNIDQNPKYHPEGNVLNHVFMVVDKASQVKHKSEYPLAFMWAALLHDIGKLTTTKIRKGRITSYNHDNEQKSGSLRNTLRIAGTIGHIFLHNLSSGKCHSKVKYELCNHKAL